MMFSSDYVIHKIDANTGKVHEMVTLTKDDPDPHGTCLHDRHLYYCDAGFPVGSNVSNDPNSGWIRESICSGGLVRGRTAQRKPVPDKDLNGPRAVSRAQGIARVARMERDNY